MDGIADDAHLKLGRKFIRARVRGIIANPRNYFLAVWYSGKLAGGFVLCALGQGVFEVHTLLRSNFHGRRAIAIGKQAMQAVMLWPGVEKLTSYCPDCLPHTFMFARLCGFRAVGTHPQTWNKNGTTYAMRAVEFTKQDL